jgi:spore maturation protein CgeB
MLAHKRVLIVGLFSKGALGASFAVAFQRLGYDVLRFDYDEAYSRFSRNRLLRRTMRTFLWDRMNLRTTELARSVQPSLILAVKAPYLHPETIRDLRHSLKVPFVNYYPDNPYCGVPWDPRKTSAQRHDLVDVLREYAHVWIWHPEMAARLRHDGVTASYMPFASDTEIYHPHPNSQSVACSECHSDHRVVLIGQHNVKRENHVGAIQTHSVALWGARWTRVSPDFARRHCVHRAEVFGAASSRLYSLAGVSLNIVDDLNMPGHNMRTFEIPASAGVMLSTYTREQAEIFPEDEAASYYRHREELDSKIDRLLHDRDLRGRISRNALRLTADHTYERRATAMLQQCG